MPDLRPGTPRFVAFSTVTGEPMMSGTSAAKLLSFTCEVPSLGIDNRHVEILDCGVDTPDVTGRDVPLVEARQRFPTVFRGEETGLPPVALSPDVDLPRLGLAGFAPIAGLPVLEN